MSAEYLQLAIIMSSAGSQRSEFQKEKRHLGDKTYLMIKNYDQRVIRMPGIYSVGKKKVDKGAEL